MLGFSTASLGNASMKPPASIVANLSEWNDGKGISLSNWVTLIGNFDNFIAYSRLVWPEFIEYKNRIYIADFFNEHELEKNIQNGTTEYQAQLFQNCLDVATIFPEDEENWEEEKVLYLANTLKSSWEASLKTNFPNRVFNVFIDNCLHEENVGDLLVTFAEKIPNKAMNRMVF